MSIFMRPRMFRSASNPRGCLCDEALLAHEGRHQSLAELSLTTSDWIRRSLDQFLSSFVSILLLQIARPNRISTTICPTRSQKLHPPRTSAVAVPSLTGLLMQGHVHVAREISRREFGVLIGQEWRGNRRNSRWISRWAEWPP